MASWTKEQIITLLDTNDMAVVKGIVAIFNNQTADEQTSQSTRYDNGIGFNGCDAQILSSFAHQIINWSKETQPRFRFPLSPKQLAIGRKKIKKYARQLLLIAEANAPQPAKPVTAAEPGAEAREDLKWKRRFAAAEAACERRAFEAKLTRDRRAGIAI